MAYNIRNVIDVANKLQGMPPDRKTFGYALGIAKGTVAAGEPLIKGPYTSAEAVAEELGSNNPLVKQAEIYFSGGWFGKPFQYYAALINTETLASLPAWTAGQSYAVDDKVSETSEELKGYICTFAHVSSGTFSQELWKSIEEPSEGAESVAEWAEDTAYNAGDKVKVLKAGQDSEYDFYECNFAHTSGVEFQKNCWEAYVPTGKPMEEWATDILQDSANFYIILPTTEFSVAELVALAGKVESAAAPKTCAMMYGGTDAYDKQAATDLGAKLKALKYDRTMVCYDSPDSLGNVQDIAAAAISGYATVSFTSARPSIVMANKSLKGVTSLDLKDSVYSALQGKNYNFYTKTTDIETDMFIDARMASGQFFDTVQAADWLAYDMKYKLVNLVQSRGKIPFTEDGLAIVKQTISETCAEALSAGIIGTGYDQDNNLIENGYLIDIPELSEISKTDKAKRILRDVKVTFLLAGAIQVINILNDIQL